MLVMMTIEDMLADFGCQSTAASTVEQALALIKLQTFDAAMLDMNLNGSQTYVLADALAARGVLFIFVTGYVGDAMWESHRDRPVLRKPFRSMDLADALTRLLTG